MPIEIGKYQLQDQPLVEDGFGALYEGRDLENNQPVLVKALHGNIPRNEEASAIQPLQGLLHVSLLPAFDELVVKNRRYLVCARPAGSELLQDALARLRAEGLVGRHLLLTIILEVCQAAEVLHRSGLACAQIYPAAILVNTAAPLQTYLLCFGALAPRPTCAYIEHPGNLLYVPQDQLRGGADFSADIYALGMLVNQCFSSRAPYQGADPYLLAEQIMWGEPAPFEADTSGLPGALAQAAGAELEALGAVAARALQRSPSARYANLAALRAELDPLAERLAPIELGARLFASQQYDQAAAVLETLTDGPQAARAYLMLGQIYGFQHGEYEKGALAFKRALKEAPDLVTARLNLARLYSHFDRHTLAQRTLLELLEANPNDRQLMLEYADVLRASGDLAAALNVLHRMTEVNPYDLPAYIKAISLALGAGDLKAADADCQRAVERVVQVVHLGNLDALEVAEIYFLRGLIQRRQGRAQRALAWLQKALEYYPYHARAHTTLAELYTEVGDTEKALQHFITGMSLSPDQKGVMEGLARILESQKTPPPEQTGEGGT